MDQFWTKNVAKLELLLNFWIRSFLTVVKMPVSNGLKWTEIQNLKGNIRFSWSNKFEKYNFQTYHATFNFPVSNPTRSYF